MSTFNVAAVALVSSFAFSYFNDKTNGKKDQLLRDELKDRVSSQLQEQNQRVRELEIAQDQLKAKLIEQEQIEALIQKKIDENENERLIGEGKNKTLQLKLRGQSRQGQFGQRNPGFGTSGYSQEQESDVEKLQKELIQTREDMVQQLREMKEQNQELLAQLKSAFENKASEEKKEDSKASPENPYGNKLLNSSVQSEEAKEPEKLDYIEEELEEAEKEAIKDSLEKLIEKCKEEKVESNLPKIKIPMNQMLKNPKQKKASKRIYAKQGIFGQVFQKAS